MISNENKIAEISKKLKQKGYRFAANRDIILEILFKAEKPLKISQIVNRVKSKDSTTKVADTTIYRQLETLVTEGFVKTILFLDGHIRYEIDSGDDHHHLVCIKCEKVIPVYLDKHLEDLESKIEKSEDFEITTHTLEFFGKCNSCRS